MATYNAVYTSNFFRVKNREAFIEWCDRIGLRYHLEDDRVSFADYGSLPGSYCNEDEEEEIDIDLSEELAKHLANGEVAIYSEVGYEKLRYTAGYATAVNSAGETRQINLTDIDFLAQELRTGGDPQ